jgi:peroxiredoxin family protein
MAIVCFSGTVDKLMAVSTLTTGAAAMGQDVEIFLTFWGLEAFRKDKVRTNMKFSADFAEYAEPAMQAMQAKGVRHWLDTLYDASEIGNVTVKACSISDGRWMTSIRSSRRSQAWRRSSVMPRMPVSPSSSSNLHPIQS